LSATHKGLAIDNVSSIQNIIEDKVVKMPRSYHDQATSISQELWLGERRLRYQSGDWPDVFMAFSTFLTETLALPFEIKLVTCLETSATDPRTGESRIYPSIDGKMRTVFPAIFNMVAESFIEDTEDGRLYCLSSKSHPKIERKDRYGYGRTWIDPTMLKILTYIAGKGGEESEIESRIGGTNMETQKKGR
jgi:hypothetical protein